MKKLIPLTIVVLIFVFGQVNAQNNFKKALDDFHYVLAFTYHPMADDNNFKPIRERSGKLLDAALAIEKELEDSEYTHGLEQKTEQLVEQCKALDEVIKLNADDGIIKSRLSGIHDLFHELETLHQQFIDEE